MISHRPRREERIWLMIRCIPRERRDRAGGGTSCVSLRPRTGEEHLRVLRLDVKAGLQARAGGGVRFETRAFAGPSSARISDAGRFLGRWSAPRAGSTARSSARAGRRELREASRGRRARERSTRRWPPRPGGAPRLGVLEALRRRIVDSCARPSRRCRCSSAMSGIASRGSGTLEPSTASPILRGLLSAASALVWAVVPRNPAGLPPPRSRRHRSPKLRPL